MTQHREPSELLVRRDCKNHPNEKCRCQKLFPATLSEVQAWLRENGHAEEIWEVFDKNGKCAAIYRTEKWAEERAKKLSFYSSETHTAVPVLISRLEK